jgi:hypothetical protein
VPGVAASTPLLKSIAYLGTQVEPVYAVDPATFATVVETHGFRTHGEMHSVGGAPSTTNAVVARLRSRQDAIFIGERYFRDYALKTGDLLRLRLPDARKQFHTAPFHIAGILGSFASTPGPERPSPTSPTSSARPARTARARSSSG